jgi:hypothetical protein
MKATEIDAVWPITLRFLARTASKYEAPDDGHAHVRPTRAIMSLATCSPLRRCVVTFRDDMVSP